MMSTNNHTLHKFATESAAVVHREHLLRLGHTCFSIFKGAGEQKGCWCFWQA